jgi:hypothetical protein
MVGTASLSRRLAQWVVGLRYDDLPPAVVDRAKGVTLHSLASVLLGSRSIASTRPPATTSRTSTNSTIELRVGRNELARSVQPDGSQPA